MLKQLGAKVADQWDNLRDLMPGSMMGKVIGSGLAVYLVGAVGVGWYWSQEPDSFSVAENARAEAQLHGHTDKAGTIGYATTTTLVRIAETLLDKPGGYLANDRLPPGLWLDNIPSWEYGVLIQLRDMSRSLRKDISRSQSQSTEDKDLTIVEPQFNFDSNSWILPSSEGEYRQGIKALIRYRDRLVDDNQSDAQFYARSDNLRNWLMDVETRLGSLSQRLSASVGKSQVNIDLAGDPSATQSSYKPDQQEVKTPWSEIDDVFYEARGTAWALIHILKAVETDFQGVLKDKNAEVSLRQIIRELEATQDALWSPMILNGSGFGMFANHSLVMASYISRANAAIIDLRELLSRG
ncbi:MULTISPECIES: DUF2333 family protein [Oceanospirillales]|uniref:DUF2333 domain-containing protein n=1 Tax=Oceanospirillum linum TaxID=966 RepID=A0A1T1H9G4_OCELI|nr:hypothetical protein BTA35_0213490 [Oceanospirillum linum]SEG35311.1 hypothetical protein SAMN04489856_108154 [Oleiphilus messinensis]SMP29896.1 hypothetical protein SAMN06264348_107154 [Oceanospirillum linum]